MGVRRCIDYKLLSKVLLEPPSQSPCLQASRQGNFRGLAKCTRAHNPGCIMLPPLPYPLVANQGQQNWAAQQLQRSGQAARCHPPATERTSRHTPVQKNVPWHPAGSLGTSLAIWPRTWPRFRACLGTSLAAACKTIVFKFAVISSFVARQRCWVMFAC